MIPLSLVMGSDTFLMFNVSSMVANAGEWVQSMHALYKSILAFSVAFSAATTSPESILICDRVFDGIDLLVNVMVLVSLGLTRCVDGKTVVRSGSARGVKWSTHGSCEITILAFVCSGGCRKSNRAISDLLRFCWMILSES